MAVPKRRVADLQGRGAGTSAPPGDDRGTREGFHGHHAALQLSAVRDQGPLYAEAPTNPRVGFHVLPWSGPVAASSVVTCVAFKPQAIL